MPKERFSISITKPSISNAPPGDGENLDLAPRREKSLEREFQSTIKTLNKLLVTFSPYDPNGDQSMAGKNHHGFISH